jgi:hypothetical protein
MSATARLTAQDIDRRILDLQTVLDRTTASLVELDNDVTRQLLDASTSLSGATADAWADAANRHAALWQEQLALRGVLVEVVEVRGTKKAPSQPALERLDELLAGASVEVPGEREDGRRGLIDGPDPVVRHTIDDVLAQMSSDYEVVAQIVATVSQVWGECTERIEGVTAGVSALEVRMQDCGMRRPNQLVVIGQAVKDAHALARTDPLSFDPATIEALEAQLRRAQTTVDESVRHREAERLELADAYHGVQVAVAALDDCRHRLEVVAEKMVVTETSLQALESASRRVEELQEEYERAVQLGTQASADGVRRKAEALLGDLSRLSVAEETRRARRDELRGLLGAYHAKAQAVGLAEDLALDELYSAAADALYVAPCDLELSERLVEDFRHAVHGRSEGAP